MTKPRNTGNNHPRTYSCRRVYCALFMWFSLLTGCASNNGHAPVTEAWQQSLKSTITYKVQAGDTLYSVAWAYGLDYRQVAALNNITAPGYHIQVGQKLRLNPASSAANTKLTASTPPSTGLTSKTVIATPITTSPTFAATNNTNNTQNDNTATNTNQQSTGAPVAPTTTHITTIMSVPTVQRAGIFWAWPAHGFILNNFTANDLNKGINIAGKAGSPVLAAADGKVVYASNGLHGYGELIIIKHNDEFLSAYAHNQQLLVQEGQMVKVGQLIARMGNTECQRVMLHFEIRKAGKPVDPNKYLPPR